MTADKTEPAMPRTLMMAQGYPQTTVRTSGRTGVAPALPVDADPDVTRAVAGKVRHRLSLQCVVGRSFRTYGTGPRLVDTLSEDGMCERAFKVEVAIVAVTVRIEDVVPFNLIGCPPAP